MQKRAIRTIAGAQYNAHTNTLFKELHILKLNDVYKTEVAKIIFKFKQNSLPYRIQNVFICNHTIHDRATRQHDDLHIKKCRTTLASQHISSRGPQIWNALPTELKNATSGTLNTFSTKVVTLYIAEYVD